MHAIYLRHKKKLLPPRPTSPREAEPNPALLAAFLKNIEPLGFTFSEDLQHRVRLLNAEEIEPFYHQVVEALREMVGAHVIFKPMYPGFPRQVMEKSGTELYLRAILHYLTHLRPSQHGPGRPLFQDRVMLREIGLGAQDEFDQIFTNLAGASGSISPADKADVVWYTKHYGDRIAKLLPEKVPNKENFAHLAGALIVNTSLGESFVHTHAKTATDLLRVAVAMSEGDESLAAVTKFRSFSRRHRRILLGALERCSNLTEDMLRYPEPWKRLGERLHPGEHAKTLPRVAEAFDVLRNKKPFRGFQTQVECALAEKNSAEALQLLATRPGYLARRLDQLLRLAQADWNEVTTAFSQVADAVSTPVLLQVTSHFQHRHEGGQVRTVFPKGTVSKVQTLPVVPPPFAPEASQAVVTICRDALLRRFAKLPPLGRVYLGPALRRYLAPFSQRSASKALRTLVRGSRLLLPDGKDTVRFFLWWKEGAVNGVPTGRVDIDLSAVMYGSEWNYLEHISYTNLKSARYRFVHSGDIVTAPNGACEFIDLDIPSILAFGGRYVVMSVNSFSYQPFCHLPECFAGWSMRSEPNSGEVFEARAVQDKVDLAADTRVCLPVILDLQEREVIWCDLALNGEPRWNNVETNAGGMVLMGLAMTNLKKTTLYDLLELHATARGTLLSESEAASADTVFSEEAGTQYEIGQILAHYMGS